MPEKTAPPQPSPGPATAVPTELPPINLPSGVYMPAFASYSYTPAGRLSTAFMNRFMAGPSSARKLAEAV